VWRKKPCGLQKLADQVRPALLDLLVRHVDHGLGQTTDSLAYCLHDAVD